MAKLCLAREPVFFKETPLMQLEETSGREEIKLYMRQLEDRRELRKEERIRGIELEIEKL